jgi:hypothetical protein
MEQITLRRIGGSLYFRMPPRFIHMHNLKEGDAFFWTPGRDGTSLKIIKSEVLAEQVTELIDKAVGDKI